MRGSALLGLAVVLHLGSVTAAVAAPRTAEEVIAAIRLATARYVDVAKAREDGFVQVSGMEPRHGVHFINPHTQVFSAAAGVIRGDLDLARPPMLLYVEHGGTWQLVGVEYALPARPASNPLPGAEWHEHEASCHYRDWRELPAARAADCPARHPASGAGFTLWHPTFFVAHVWAWYPNPDGPFAHENRWLSVWGGTPTPAAHRHDRNAAEIAYSEFNHRIAGSFLLVLAALAVWTLARPQQALPRVMAAGGWILLGLYVFVMADPEAWPIGPKSFVEVFDDALVLQHKVFALIPIAIGLVEVARATGVTTRAAWMLPALVLAGSVALFSHDHERTFHLDRIFFQHATMGAVGVLAGVTLLVARRRQAWVRRAQWAWPAVLLATAAVLVLYRE